MFCSRCGTELPPEASFCSGCGAAVQSRTNVTAPTGTSSAPTEGGDVTGGIIPYKNPQALIGYYCGVFSMIPFLGLPLGIVAIPLGIAGLRRHRAHPVVRGVVHAWVALIFGTISVLLWGGLLVLFLHSLMTG